MFRQSFIHSLYKISIGRKINAKTDFIQIIVQYNNNNNTAEDAIIESTLKISETEKNKLKNRSKYLHIT
jgi:hypothetical protein